MPIYLMGPHSARPTMGSWVEDLGCRNTAPRHPVHILKVPGELRREAREEGLGPPPRWAGNVCTDTGSRAWPLLHPPS